jgi:hypothetical protein
LLSLQIRYEGVYFFGGLNAQNQILGELLVLKIDQRPMEWVKPETTGAAPCKIYQLTF